MGYSGDGGAATNAELSLPSGLAVTARAMFSSLWLEAMWCAKCRLNRRHSNGGWNWDGRLRG